MSGRSLAGWDVWVVSPWRFRGRWRWGAENLDTGERRIGRLRSSELAALKAAVKLGAICVCRPRYGYEESGSLEKGEGKDAVAGIFAELGIKRGEDFE